MDVRNQINQNHNSMMMVGLLAFVAILFGIGALILFTVLI